MSDNVKIFGIFNESGALVTVFTNKEEALDYLIDNCEDMLYITSGTIELPVISEEDDDESD